MTRTSTKVSQPDLITRKQVAEILQTSVWQVRTSEKRMGLDAARYDLNSRLIRYSREDVLRVLESHRKNR
jgi:hypothetical protein